MIINPTPFTPADVGYDASRLEALNRHFERLIKEGKLQFANYCLSRDGKVFADAAIGPRSFRPEDKTEARPDAIQWIASITKIFCSTAIFCLVEDGLLRPLQPASEILPEMATPPYKDITIAQLLSHTSGLHPDGGCFENKYFKTPWDYIGRMRDTPWLEAGLSVGLRTKPGTEWQYCSFGFVILGEIISRVSGMNCHDFIKTRIIDPCGMTDTFFPIRFPKTEAERALMTRFAERINIRDKEDEEFIAAVRKGKFPEPGEDDAPFEHVPQTGGGLMSTAQDLNKFGRMLLNKGYTDDGTRVLGRLAVDRMTENITAPEIRNYCWGSPGNHRDYALGPDRRRDEDCFYSKSTFYHEGAGACALLIDPEERMVASWFVPFIGGWYPEGLFSATNVMWSGLK